MPSYTVQLIDVEVEAPTPEKALEIAADRIHADPLFYRNFVNENEEEES